MREKHYIQANVLMGITACNSVNQRAMEGHFERTESKTMPKLEAYIL